MPKIVDHDARREQISVIAVVLIALMINGLQHA